MDDVVATDIWARNLHTSRIHIRWLALKLIQLRIEGIYQEAGTMQKHQQPSYAARPRPDFLRAHVPPPPDSNPDVPPEQPPQPAPDREVDLPPREDPERIRDPQAGKLI